MTMACTELYERSFICGKLTKNFITPSALASSTILIPTHHAELGIAASIWLQSLVEDAA